MNDFENIYGDYQPPSALEKVANAFRKLGHTLSMIPVLGVFTAFAPVGVAAILDSVDGFFNKGFGAGTKKLVSGGVDTVVTFGTTTGLPVFQWVSGLATKESIGELARNGSDAVLDSFIPDSLSGRKNPTQIARETQVLGANPMMTASMPAAVGYAQPPMQMGMQATVNPATLAPVQPNQWRQMEAQRRGQSLAQADGQWMRNNREDAVALQRATAPEQQLGAS